MGREGVWVHNAAGRECAQIRSIYLRLRNQGKTPNEIFRMLRQRLPKATKEFIGSALDEAMAKDVFPGRTNLWTQGPEKTPGANMWRHFKDHAQDFPGVDDPVTYVQRARSFVENTPGRAQTGIRRARGALEVDPATGEKLLERVILDLETGEFMAQVISGPERGAVKTYFVRPGTRAQRMQYFLEQFH